MEYALVYGFRRFAACKKLGWKSIPSYIKDEKVSKDIPIDNIKIIQKNSRLTASDADSNSLLVSIKQHGLIEPIGIAPIDELTKKDFLINNLTENLQRKDLTPLELKNKIDELRHEGLNYSEIATILGIAPSRIKQLGLIRSEFLKDANFIGSGNNKNGRLPYVIVDKIASQIYMNLKAKQDLIEYCKKEEVGQRLLTIILTFYQVTRNLDDAIALSKTYEPCTINIPIKKELMEQASKKYKLPKGTIVKGMLTGKIKLDTKLFYSR